MESAIGLRIKARRKELNMTQRELAARIGYTDHTMIARIEAGKTDPPMSRVLQFAKALGVTPGQLTGWDEVPEVPGEITSQMLMESGALAMVQDYMILDEADRQMVGALVASLAAKNKEG